jgi:NADPH-dependent glutamate synthase beta subunit-like oxidoreductase
LEEKNIKVAIIGSGPAGLTAAWDLACAAGYKATIFEAMEKLGGMLSTEFRTTACRLKSWTGKSITCLESG